MSLLSSYAAPAVAGVGSTQTVYTYNDDRALTNVARPDGTSIQIGYDTAGRTSTLTHGTTTLTYGYSSTTGNVSSITSTTGENLAYGYDGALLTSTTWSGPVAGSVSRTYDGDFRLATESINGGSSVTYAYDPDSVITAAGALTITPHAKTALTTATSLGSTTESFDYDDYGAVSVYAAKYGTANLLSVTYTRDALGRIKTKTETASGVTDLFEYTYDLRGRLTDVKKNGAATSHYSYDGNGNRLTGPTGSPTATYDAQDRLKTYGTKTYAYSDAGELRTMTDGTSTTTYTYDPLGNLTRVVLPTKTIDYVLDGAGRRVGRKVDGALALPGHFFSWRSERPHLQAASRARRSELE